MLYFKPKDLILKRLWPYGLSLLLLAGCGGGGGTPSPQTTVVVTPPPSTPITTPPTTAPTPAPAVCSLADQKLWLRNHFQRTYWWTGLAPTPAPGGDDQPLADYFRSLMFTGNASFPADRYSGYGSLSGFSQFYDEGTELGFGVAVQGQEIFGQPDQPLYVRYVEPRSPAAKAGIQRGDQVLALNGRGTPERLASSDFADLVPSTEGQPLTLLLRRDGRDFALRIEAAVYPLVQVQAVGALRSALNRPVGYLYLHNFTDQAKPDLITAFEGFAQQGLREVIVDLRYNSGGLVHMAERLASHLGGNAVQNAVFAKLSYNANNTYRNRTYRFDDPVGWTGVRRAYVLTGMRTCSASEQVISGLRGAGVEVITIGSQTCGKPVGFSPETYCDTVYSIVAFESLNARGEGRYFSGIAPTCSVADQPISGALGSSQDALVQAALSHLDTGVCPQTPKAQRRPGVVYPPPGTKPTTLTVSDVS